MTSSVGELVFRKKANIYLSPIFTYFAPPQCEHVYVLGHCAKIHLNER